MNKKFVIIAVSVAILSGCAGSANHKILSANQAGDEGLSCRQMDEEIVRAQVIIDGVNEDKDDISGADILDGLLWFPFNLIAKNGNYDNAIKAASDRIAHLQGLKKEKKCIGMTDIEHTNAAEQITDKLIELTKMHEAGQLSNSEYKAAKRKLLGME